VTIGHQGWNVVVRRGVGFGGRGGSEQRWERKEVAGARRAVRNECKDFGYQSLLDGCFLGLPLTNEPFS
jgi:hypothetical protein